jgi:hypothetical protein
MDEKKTSEQVITELRHRVSVLETERERAEQAAA